MQIMDEALAKTFLKRIDKYRPRVEWTQTKKGVYTLEVGVPSTASNYCNMEATLYKRFADRMDILQTHKDSTLLYINNVKVHPMLRGNGIATSMVQAAALAGMEAGADIMYGLVGMNEVGNASRNHMIKINEEIAGKGGIEFHDGDFGGRRLELTPEQAKSGNGQYCVMVNLKNVEPGADWAVPLFETGIRPF